MNVKHYLKIVRYSLYDNYRCVLRLSRWYLEQRFVTRRRRSEFHTVESWNVNGNVISLKEIPLKRNETATILAIPLSSLLSVVYRETDIFKVGA